MAPFYFEWATADLAFLVSFHVWVLKKRKVFLNLTGKTNLEGVGVGVAPKEPSNSILIFAQVLQPKEGPLSGAPDAALRMSPRDFFTFTFMNCFIA